MDSSAKMSDKKVLNKKRIILIVTLSISALIVLVTLILMDFSSFGVPKIKDLTGKGLIDSNIYYSGSKLYDYLENFNADALKALLTVHAIDYVFMLSVCVFEIAFLALLANDNFKILFLGTFAFLELFFDLSENLFVDFVVRKLPEKTSMISGLAGGMTLCKWIFTGAYLIAVLAVAGYILTKKIRAKKNGDDLEVQNGDSEEEKSNPDERTETIETSQSEAEE